MDNVIFANGFEDYIEEIFVCPSRTLSTRSINQEFVAWRHQDRMILSQIYSSLTPEIMAQIIEHSTSHFAWTMLEKIFASSSLAIIMQLHLELQSTKKDSISMIDYLMKIKGIADSLAAIGEPVSEQDQIMNLFAGPGAYYNAFMTEINTRDDRVSLETVQSMLVSFEHRLK